MATLLLAYFIAALYRSDFWGNILSPANAFLAAGVLLWAYIKSNPAVRTRVVLLLFSAACAAWGIADTLWAVIEFSGGIPLDNMILWVIYTIPNCLLFLSLIIFVSHQFRKWDLVQFAIDLIVNALIIVVMFWIVFLRKDMGVLHVLIESDFTSILSIATDTITCIIIFSRLLSMRSGKVSAFMKIILTGIVLYSWVDLLYYYMEFNTLYFPNTIVDFLYMLALAIIAFGALWKTYMVSTVYDALEVTNIGGKMRWIYLLVFPLLSIVLMETDFVEVQVDAFDILTFAILIFIYWASCKYIQLSLEKEALLKQQNVYLERQIAEQVTELTFLTNQDTLTTLFNRRYFMTSLDETLANKRTNETVALLLIDMDRFKTINDTFGHDVGDKVLIDISVRMNAWNNYGATIARLGGDEFAVMLASQYTQKDIEDICEELISLYNEPLNVGEYKLSVTISVGVAIVTAESCDGKTLMQNADIAMYRAKAQGYNRYQVFDVFMSQDFKKALELEALLRQTDVDQDFELYYQPQYALPGRELIGAEALIRWHHAEHGFIPPNVFIPIAEQIDYIGKIGEWVVREAARQAEIWNKQFDLPLKVGFNVSPKQLKNDRLIKLIKSLIKEGYADPAHLDAEITENVMMNSEAVFGKAFAAFHELGITVSIDDFGSGYSALGNLNKFQFDRIKIDKSLIDNISTRSSGGVDIVRAVINMAHASGIMTIAEGVESAEQLDILSKLGCDQVQGYLLGRPVPSEVFEERYIKPVLGAVKAG